ncbi:hypothetical protein A5652_10135 [Mycobacterium sp. 1165178.9]|nr:hypothetical protein A5652_10135 [Mycobacterium sp. 1165178.9]
MKHAVVMLAGVLVLPDEGTDEEQGREDEDDAGDDHHPGRRGVEPRRCHPVRGRLRRWPND